MVFDIGLCVVSGKGDARPADDTSKSGPGRAWMLVLLRRKFFFLE